MTKEQREAIKSLNEFANTKYGAFTAKEGQTVLNLIQEQQEENKKKDKIINNAIVEIEDIRQYFSEDLQPEFIRVLEILKDKKVIDW